MNKNIFHWIIFVSIALLILGSYSTVLLQSPPANPSPPNPSPDAGLSAGQIASAQADFTSFWAGASGFLWSWDGWGPSTTSLINRLPQNTPQDDKDKLKNKLQDFGKKIGGCWALPNGDRPIDTDWLKAKKTAFENAASSGAAALNTAIDTANTEADAKIAKWCNAGKSAAQRAFCPCNFNCAGDDNKGKTWSTTSYTCANNCISPATCQTSTCTCVPPEPKNSESQPSSGSTGKSN